MYPLCFWYRSAQAPFVSHAASLQVNERKFILLHCPLPKSDPGHPWPSSSNVSNSSVKQSARLAGHLWVLCSQFWGVSRFTYCDMEKWIWFLLSGLWRVRGEYQEGSRGSHFTCGAGQAGSSSFWPALVREGLKQKRPRMSGECTHQKIMGDACLRSHRGIRS